MKLLAVAICLLCAVPAASADSVNLYSARKEQRIAPILEQFTKETGIKVNLLTGTSSSLIKRVELEGANTQADALLTVDVGRLHLIKALGLTQSVTSQKLNTVIPEPYRDPDAHWFGLSQRVRPIVYSRNRVDRDSLTSYEDLAGETWRGRICLRAANNIYNQSLVASMVAAHGEAYTGDWIKGMVSNLGKNPGGGAKNQVYSIAAGECDVSLVNSYYVALMLSSRDKKQRKAAKRVSVFWPNQSDRGAHVNLSGIAVTKHAKNRENAIALIEFLAGEEAQSWYANANFEYPVIDMPYSNKILSNWGEFKADTLTLRELGRHNASAVKLMQSNGWK